MIIEKLVELIKKAAEQAVKCGDLPAFDLGGIKIESKNDRAYGDYSWSGAFESAKKLKGDPNKIAEIIKNHFELIAKNSWRVEIAGPGYLNFWMSDKTRSEYFWEMIKAGKSFGRQKQRKAKKIMVEFISANPTGPLTLGNGRGGIYGDVLASVYEFSGHKVVREYYINDAGGQIEALGHSIIKDAEAQYQGEYINVLAKKIHSKDPYQSGKLAQKEILKMIKKTVKNMGIKYDQWFSEDKELRAKGKVGAILSWLTSKGLAYEKEGAIWFRATKFGDDKDRALVKSNGEPTYFGVDCAYHKDKFVERKFDQVINIWGADHHGDVARLMGFVEALGYENHFKILLTQFVTLLRDGKPVKMSKRKGDYVLVDEVLAEVGRDAFRFFMVTKSNNTHIEFDLDLAKEQSKKNPIYYIQYAHARICSILKNAPNKKRKIDLYLLKEAEEIELITQLLRYPEIINSVVSSLEVHELANYASGLARAFHQFYDQHKVITTDVNLSASRRTLVGATKTVLASVLELLGISAPEKM